MPNHQPSAQAFAAILIDSHGTTALHQAAEEGTLKDISGVTAELLATLKDNDGWTPLHDAAFYGHLDQIPGVTADLLATVKDNHGGTPLDHAASYGHLDQITDLTITLATTLGLLNTALRPENIAAFTEDFRCHGAHYNHCHTIRTALLKAANQLPDLSPTQRTAIKAALGAAQEGGFVLPSDVLANLL